MTGRLVRISFVASTALSLASGTWSSLARGAEPNVRPFVDAGYTAPAHFGSLDLGFGFGGGFEIEQSARTSVVFRFEWDDLEHTTPAPSYPGPLSDYVALRTQLAALEWSVAFRVHPIAYAPIRPYVEVGTGVRMVHSRENGYGYGYADTKEGDPEVRPEGNIGTARAGFTTARHRGAGLFLESGCSVVLRNPEHYTIVPVRIGIVFP